MATRRRTTDAPAPGSVPTSSRSDPGREDANRIEGARQSTKTAIRQIVRRYRETFERLAR